MCWLDSVAKADDGKAVDATAAPGGKSAAGREAARTGRIRLLIDDDVNASWEGQRPVNRINAGTKYFILTAGNNKIVHRHILIKVLHPRSKKAFRVFRE